MQSGSRCQALVNVEFLARVLPSSKDEPPFIFVLNMQWCWKKQVRWSTSRCYQDGGIPMDCMTLSLFQWDQWKTLVIILSPLLFSPLVKCERWFWDFSVSISCNGDAGIILTIFSPANESSYLDINSKDQKTQSITKKLPHVL